MWPGVLCGGTHQPNGKPHTNNTGPINLQDTTIRIDLNLEGTTLAHGAVDISGAKIGGRLDCSGGKFRNHGDIALKARGIETKGSVYLKKGFEAEGEVMLWGAKIGGQLDCSKGIFRNPCDIALNAENIETNGSVYLKKGFEAEGEVMLGSARVGGQMDLRGVFQERLVLEHAVVRKLVDDTGCRPEQGMLFLDGFQYEEIAYESPVEWKDRVQWLALQEKFTPGPYEQLAKVFQARGEARAARKVLIAKHKRQIRSVELSPVRLGPVVVSGVRRRRLSPVLCFRRLLGLLVGYGHEPWRAAWFLVGIVLVAWGTFTAAAGSEQIVPVAEPHNTEALERATGNKGVHADKCVFEMAYPCFHGIWYALDTAVPFVDLRRQSYWVPVGGYRWAMWGVIVAGWLLVSAVAIGLTLLFRE